MPRLKVVVPDDEPDHAGEVRAEELRLLEAMLFASSEPLDEKSLAERLPQGVDVHAALLRLQEDYATRGVHLVRIGGKWTFRTAGDLSWLLSKETVETRKLSRAAIETLAIIAYHQPVTRTEIEDIRGVSASPRGATTPRNSSRGSGSCWYARTPIAARRDSLSPSGRGWGEGVRTSR